MPNSRIALTVMVLAFSAPALVTPPRANAQTGAPNASTPEITTTGWGEARVTPDRATIYIGVQSRASTAAAAASDNARKQRAILDSLKALGFGQDQLSTVNYSVSPEMSYPNGPGQSPRVTGYTVSNSVRVEAKRIDDVSKAIDAALAKGANEISSLQFYSSKADSVRRVALAEAVANARSDAEALARAAGGSLGPLLELSTSSMPVRPVMGMAMARVAAAPAPTPIEAGEETISANVTARWVFTAR